jgi:hypothetical protein
MSSSTLVVRLGGLAGILAGLLYFVGYAGMAELLLPVMSNLGGHVVLGLAGIATLPALVGVLARDTGRGARPGTVGYTLSFIGAAVFSIGNLAESVFAVEFGVVLFGVGLMILTVGVVVLGFGVRRGKVLPTWAMWPLVVGLLGLHTRLAERGGRLERIGGFLAYAAVALSMANAPYSIFFAERGPQTPFPFNVTYFSPSLAIFIGLVFLGIAVLRAGVLPGRWRTLPLILGLSLSSQYESWRSSTLKYLSWYSELPGCCWDTYSGRTGARRRGNLRTCGEEPMSSVPASKG